MFIEERGLCNKLGYNSAQLRSLKAQNFVFKEIIE